MQHVIYDNFDQVYAFWEIGSLVYMKMLAYRSEETLSPRAFFFFSDMITTKTNAPSSKRKLLGNFVNCPLSWHLF